MQLDVLGPDGITNAWQRLFIPHALFVGEAFEVLAALAGGQKWYPVAENALSYSWLTLAHGPGWITYEEDTQASAGLEALMRLTGSGYTQLHTRRKPDHVDVVMGTRTHRLETPFRMTFEEAQRADLYHTQYRHMPIGSAHATLLAAREAENPSTIAVVTSTRGVA